MKQRQEIEWNTPSGLIPAPNQVLGKVSKVASLRRIEVHWIAHLLSDYHAVVDVRRKVYHGNVVVLVGDVVPVR